MADINLGAGAIGTSVVTLSASAVQVVTFVEDLNQVEVISDGAAAVWWTCDGTTPAVGVGYYMPAAASVDSRLVPTSGNTVAKVFSTGTPAVRVQRAS